jgi:CheY-like chemotaxis protein
VLKKQLVKHGYEVYVASNGQEALDFLTSPTQEVQIDCILMDVCMPVMDGLTAARMIREWEKRTNLNSKDVSGSLKSGPRLSRGRSFNSDTSNWSLDTEDSDLICSRLPIIAISANARPEQTNDAIIAGMDDTIAKPFRIADLIPRIDHLLSRRGSSART